MSEPVCIACPQAPLHKNLQPNSTSYTAHKLFHFSCCIGNSIQIALDPVGVHLFNKFSLTQTQEFHIIDYCSHHHSTETCTSPCPWKQLPLTSWWKWILPLQCLCSSLFVHNSCNVLNCILLMQDNRLAEKPNSMTAKSWMSLWEQEMDTSGHC